MWLNDPGSAVFHRTAGRAPANPHKTAKIALIMMDARRLSWRCRTLILSGLTGDWPRSNTEVQLAFALQLKEALRHREAQTPDELDRGDALGDILDRFLREVEAEADNFIVTSILLLDGMVLRHGAAPALPAAYCAAIDGSTIGPCAGSCGTAAYSKKPVYVTDIATDPLWADYSALALAHGLRACWSTPIFDDQKAVLGTFAIYHTTTSGPDQDEIEAISDITAHVARTIQWSRTAEDMTRARDPVIRNQ
jgi:GAF domain-containing protein